MNANQFKIFIQDSSFRFTTNRIMYLLLIIFAFEYYLTEKLNLTAEVKDVTSIFLGIIVFAILVLYIASYYRTEKLRGQLVGIIEFNDDSIVIDNNTILIDNIQQIEFQLADYVGRRDRYGRYDLNLNPRVSIGVKNNCEIKTIDGSSHRIYFQIINGSDFQRNRKTIIHYHKAGKISLKKLSELLGSISYKEIQELKNEISK